METNMILGKDKRKKPWVWLVLFALLILGGILVFRIVRNIRISERAEQNGQALVELVSELGDGQTVFLNDIVPFEWDFFVVYDLYTSRDSNRACMGNPWFDDFIMRTYLCFFYEDSLVARITSPPFNFSHEVLLRNGDISTSRSMSGSPADNFEFLVTTGSLRWLYDHELVGTYPFLIFRSRVNSTSYPIFLVF